MPNKEQQNFITQGVINGEPLGGCFDYLSEGQDFLGKNEIPKGLIYEKLEPFKPSKRINLDNLNFKY